jgi:type IV pilus assembly protein PilB
LTRAAPPACGFDGRYTRHTEEAVLSDGTPLGALLLREGLVTEAQLDAALAEQAHSDKPLGRVLIEAGTVSEADVVRTLARQVGLDFVDLTTVMIDHGVVALITEAVARRYQAIPISWTDGRLVVAMADPANVFAIDDIRALTGKECVTVVATPSQITEIIDRFFRLDTEADTVAQLAADEFDDTDDSLTHLHEVVEDAPIVKFVNLLITQAVGDRASDIHVEPTEHDLRIRFRIDGVLHEVMHAPRGIQAGVISRLKVMAEINIAERRVPQDGRISMRVGGRMIDLRVATLPTVYGEKVVMRILDKGNAVLRLSELGFLPTTLGRFETAYRKPYGTILVTGPTGSGKSTTLYATLNILNEPHRNIITVEDPVEYRLPGINQVQIHPKAGMTFALALRSILRSDPDVILVGEIRDRETAIIAIEAALTGHLVLSTLHTNDAASTPMRLVEMGVEPFLVTSALDCVVAQRLARKLCDKCKEAYQPTEAELREVGWDMEGFDDWPVLHRAIGCPSCGRTGYRGRFGIHEVMLLSEDVERAVIERRSTEELAKIAVMQGMLTLRQDGLRKVAMGMTSLEEIFRVVA